MRTRLAAPKAITATAHKLAYSVYRILRFGTEKVGRGQDDNECGYQHHLHAHLTRR